MLPNKSSAGNSEWAGCNTRMQHQDATPGCNTRMPWLGAAVAAASPHQTLPAAPVASPHHTLSAAPAAALPHQTLPAAAARNTPLKMHGKGDGDGLVLDENAEAKQQQQFVVLQRIGDGAHHHQLHPPGASAVGVPSSAANPNQQPPSEDTKLLHPLGPSGAPGLAVPSKDTQVSAAMIRHGGDASADASFVKTQPIDP